MGAVGPGGRAVPPGGAADRLADLRPRGHQQPARVVVVPTSPPTSPARLWPTSSSRSTPATSPPCRFGGPELVLDAVAAHGWLRDIDQPDAAATDPTFTSHISLGEVPPLIQDADPRALTTAADEAGPAGWQAWAEPALGAPCLWAASFGASVPHDLVAAFAASLSSTAPVLRRVLPEATRELTAAGRRPGTIDGTPQPDGKRPGPRTGAGLLVFPSGARVGHRVGGRRPGDEYRVPGLPGPR